MLPIVSVTVPPDFRSPSMAAPISCPSSVSSSMPSPSYSQVPLTAVSLPSADASVSLNPPSSVMRSTKRNSSIT